jgi:galactokinase
MNRIVPTDDVYRNVSVRAPGRVNLIGDHTDYNEGLALPMAIDLQTAVGFIESGSGRLLLYTTFDPHPADLPVDIPFDPDVLAGITPPWASLAAAVAAQVAAPHGGVGRITSTLPSGAGLSSSAAFSVALATALGFAAPPRVMAELCRRAEAAVGVSVGLMDPMVVTGAEAGKAMMIDFSTLHFEHVSIPEDAHIVVVHSGIDRVLRATPYNARRAECEAAAVELGVPLGRAEQADLPGMLDPVLRRRTRHVVTECQRVLAYADAMASGDLAAAGTLMLESHRSLAQDFEASTPRVDELVGSLASMPGVYGARMTGGGFGGCVVALTEPGALNPSTWGDRAWRVIPSAGVSLTERPAAPENFEGGGDAV